MDQQNRSRNALRIRWAREAIRANGLDALVCALPANMLLLTDYWPVIGSALVVAGQERTVLIAPSDELALAQANPVAEVRPFQPGSLDRIETASQAIQISLAEAIMSMRIERGRIGFEGGEWLEPASYVSMHLYGAGIVNLLEQAAPGATLIPADGLLKDLRAKKTPTEIDRIRGACRIAESTFLGSVAEVRSGATEVEAAARFRVRLASPDAIRSGGRVSFMSGINSATAYGSFAHSTSKRMAGGELVLVHCNSYAEGYWTDITRTFCLGPPNERQRRMYDAVFEARGAALAAIGPGVPAQEVDRAARDVMRAHGFGEQFKHPTGHGVGFAAIDHNALPRIHPKSPDVLEQGMVFNVEPGVYIDGHSGMRHCDMVAVASNGCDLLTPFQPDVQAMSLD